MSEKLSQSETGGEVFNIPYETYKDESRFKGPEHVDEEAEKRIEKIKQKKLVDDYFDNISKIFDIKIGKAA